MNAKISFFCTCGATANGVIGGAQAEQKARQLEAIFRAEHTGEGHAPCDAKTAAKARRKEEREMMRAEASSGKGRA